MSIANNVAEILRIIGENPQREGLRDTPARFERALIEYTRGYGIDPATLLKSFEDGAHSYDQMVVVRDVPFYSLCEHHLAPFFGTATVAYIPSDKAPRVVGLSKLARLVDCFARRLQVQERMTVQIADALRDALDPRGVGVLVRARHLCMESRGVQKPGAETVTSALRGCFLTGEARAEFMALAAR